MVTTTDTNPYAALLEHAADTPADRVFVELFYELVNQNRPVFEQLIDTPLWRILHQRTVWSFGALYESIAEERSLLLYDEVYVRNSQRELIVLSQSGQLSLIAVSFSNEYKYAVGIDPVELYHRLSAKGYAIERLLVLFENAVETHAADAERRLALLRDRLAPIRTSREQYVHDHLERE